MSRTGGQTVIDGITVSEENRGFAAGILAMVTAPTFDKDKDKDKVRGPSHKAYDGAKKNADAANKALQNAEQRKRIADRIYATAAVGDPLDAWSDKLKGVTPEKGAK